MALNHKPLRPKAQKQSLQALMARKPLHPKAQKRAVAVMLTDLDVLTNDELSTHDGFMQCDERCIWNQERVHNCRWSRK